nr:MAG TPA: hypothetical protein [Caudoviricetes sp.]
MVSKCCCRCIIYKRKLSISRTYIIYRKTTIIVKNLWYFKMSYWKILTIACSITSTSIYTFTINRYTIN